MMLQTLPKEHLDDDTNVAEPKSKKQRTSLSLSSPVSYPKSLYMARSIASHCDVLSQAIIRSSCKELLVVTKSLVRIVSCLSCKDDKVCVLF